VKTYCGVRRFCLLILTALLLLPIGFVQAQDASPVAEPGDLPFGEVCVIPESAPISVHLEAGQEAVISFAEGCVPVIEIIGDGQGEANGSNANSVAMLPGYKSDSGFRARNSVSNVCRASSRTHDAVHVSLTHSELRAKWYYENGVNTGRSFSSSETVADYLNDGWHITDGPYFYWYYPSNPPGNPQGAEGWTEFAWIANQYRHEHHSIIWMYGNGTCSGYMQTYGTLAMALHVHHKLYY